MYHQLGSKSRSRILILFPSLYKGHCDTHTSKMTNVGWKNRRSFFIFDFHKTIFVAKAPNESALNTWKCPINQKNVRKKIGVWENIESEEWCKKINAREKFASQKNCTKNSMEKILNWKTGVRNLSFEKNSWFRKLEWKTWYWSKF